MAAFEVTTEGKERSFIHQSRLTARSEPLAYPQANCGSWLTGLARPLRLAGKTPIQQAEKRNCS
jgi:hypothetical protein